MMLHANVTLVVSKVELDYSRVSTFATLLNAKAFPQYAHICLNPETCPQYTCSHLDPEP